MAKDYADIFLKAMKTISDAAVSQLSFDKTIICHIIDNSKASEGQYTVSDGSSSFYAYSDNTEYKKNEAVYVSVPQDDFSKTKLIVGKYIADEDSNQYRYKAPWERFINMTNNLIPMRNTKEITIKANDSITKKTIATIQVNNGNQYTRMGLKADFKTYLSAYDVAQGSFGIGLNITYEIQLTSQTAPITKKVNINYTSDEMYGNPYRYDTYYSQEAVFDITKLDNIKEIEIFLYQNKDFYNKEGNYVPVADLDNIFVKDIELGLGYDALDYSEDTVILYSPNNKTYSVNAANNRKKLCARWVHVIDAESKDVRCYEDFSRIIGGIEIRWYQYLLANNISDEWAGNFWQQIPNAGDFSLEINPDITLNEDKFKVIIHPLDTDDYFESNILIFTNENPVADKATVDLIKALKITFEENEPQGEYLLYDQTNRIQDSTQTSKLRKLIATYNSLITGETTLDNAESIQWRIPLTNTMIQRPQEGKEFDSENDQVVFTEDGLYCIITRDASLQNGTIGELFNNYAEQNFRIKEYYSENATNNTVYCSIVKNKVNYTAEVQLFFGPKGTNGTDYTFLLKFEQGRNCLYHYTGRTVNDVLEQDLDPLKISASLYDYTNNIISAIDTPIPKFSWYSNDGTIVFCDNFGNELENQESYEAEEQSSDGSHLDIYIRRKDANSICQYNILKAEISMDIEIGGQTKKGTQLVAYLPIPFAYQYGYSIEGTTEIIYDTFGKCSYYYKSPYILYYDNAAQLDPDLVWETNHDDVAAADAYYPKMGEGKLKITLQDNEEQSEIKSGQLIPPSMLFDGISPKINVVARKGDIQYWIQPIFMRRNVYSSQMLNSWNGDLTIDENNGTILATMLGAGFKDSANRFNGVLMGDVSDQNHRGTAADAHAGTGLFGYHEGAQSFGFKIDGKAFIGKSGKGRIEFDGNSGKIQSMSYAAGATGMLIDLDDGFIDIQGATKSGATNTSSTSPTYTKTNSQVRISALTPYMLVKEDGTPIFQIDTTTSFIQTNDYSNINKSGARITLKGANDNPQNDSQKGKPSFELRAFSTQGGVKISSISPFIQVDVKKDNSNDPVTVFKVANDMSFLQTADYSSGANKSGARITLKGAIDNPQNDSQKGKPSFELGAFGASGGIRMQSISPYLVIQTKSGQKYTELMYIADNNYYLQSADYDKATTGTNINLTKGKITSYSFDLKAVNTNKGTIFISSTDGTYPFKIEGSGGSYFKINWNSSFEAASSAGKNVKFEFNSIKGTLNLQNGDISGGSINIGNEFFYANAEQIRIGDFGAENAQGNPRRQWFGSIDRSGSLKNSKVGMSSTASGEEYWLWADWQRHDAEFFVNGNGETGITKVYGNTSYNDGNLGSILNTIYQSIKDDWSWLIKVKQLTDIHDEVCQHDNVELDD